MDAAEDILSITAMHPMREKALKKLLLEARVDWSVLDWPVKQGKLLELVLPRQKILHEKAPWQVTDSCAWRKHCLVKLHYLPEVDSRSKE